MFIKKLNLISNWLLFICIILTNNVFAQIDKNEIKLNINSFLQTVYNGNYEVNTLIKLDDHLGDMRYYDKPTEDPYNTLINCYFFITEATSGPEDLGNIVGIYKNGNVIWYSDQNEIGIGGFFALLTTKDINDDGKVDLLITSSNGSELWIYSWDGTVGQRINDKDYWTSVIQGPEGSFELFDAEGDGIWEIRSLAEKDGSESWSWNGQLYGKWPNTPVISDTTWLPRNNVDVSIDCKIIKRDSLFAYTYKVHSYSSSKQRIDYFTVECETKNFLKSQPEGWDGRSNWVWDQEGWGTKVFYWHKPKEILPGQSLDSFKIVSSALPIISLYVVRGENMLPLTTEYTSEEDSTDFVNNSVKGFTLGPSNAPYTFVPLNFLDTLLNYIQRSFELSWIKNQTTADKYDSLFNLAKAQLQQNNNNAARTTLQTVLQQVDIDSTNNLTSEAYALLRYNTEYLLEKIPQSSPNLLVNLKNSLGNLIPASNVTYYDGSWKDAVNNGDGTFTVITTKPTVSIRVYYEYASLQADNVPAQNNTYTFQTVNAAVQLKNSLGNLIDQGTIQYYAGAWRNFGTTSNGVAYKELLPINYSFRMTYEYGSIDKQQNLSVDPTVVFQTVNAAVQLKNSFGNLIDQGTVQYYAGAWRTFGTTTNGVATKELLPINYSFRMTYEYGSQDKQQNLSVDPTVVFQTVNATVQLKNSLGNLIDQGTIQYYAGAWRSFGTTSNGVAYKELLPINYSFRMTYEYVSKDKQQNLSTNPVVDFNTVLCTVKVINSANQPLNNAEVKYYAGAWRNLGTTNVDGIATKELLPANLSFRATVGNVSQDKQQDIGLNNLVEILLNVP